MMALKRVWRRGFLLLTTLVASGCAAGLESPPYAPSALNPQGITAARIASLWWLMAALSAAIFLLVLVLLFAAILRRRRATRYTPPDSSDGDTGRGWVIRGGIILPMIVLSVVFGYTIYTLAATENPQDQASLTVKVVARRWWWEVQYPGQGVTTANEIHIPVGVPVKFELESQDVIHSLWVPELGGKMDVIPGRINTLTLQADHEGTFRGSCAEYCGLQHAQMDLLVVVQGSAEFNQWLTAQAQPAAAPTDPSAKRGQQVFLSAGCDYCHAVQGLDAQRLVASNPDLGPDLTHLASRSTIVGASLTNNTDDLAGWVIDPQHLKEGSDMPKLPISSQDLQPLLAYLQSLR